MSFIKKNANQSTHAPRKYHKLKINFHPFYKPTGDWENLWFLNSSCIVFSPAVSFKIGVKTKESSFFKWIPYALDYLPLFGKGPVLLLLEEASWLVHSTPDQAVRVRALAGDIVLCSFARHLTLTVPLFTQVYRWVLANLLLGVTLRWTSIPSRGGSNIPSCLMLQKPGYALAWWAT